MYDIDFTSMFVVFGIICAIVGWAAIEAVLWVLSHLSFNWS
jgi:hypothetical protein